MISFRCVTCGHKFDVPDRLAGKKARCKHCKTSLVIPQPVSLNRQLSPRQRRLLADEKTLRETFADGPIRIVEASGEPPEKYVLDYLVRSLRKEIKREPEPIKGHRVQVVLPPDYPRLAPTVSMLTPVFHPNIDTTTVCVGDHWAAGERLVDLLIRVGEMLAFQAYNIRSPLNGDAAMWADLNSEQFPIDPMDLRALVD
ncbi:MAG: ubiquitin-conjugating enzyme E2 [Planctomycetota bacterium]